MSITAHGVAPLRGCRFVSARRWTRSLKTVTCCACPVGARQTLPLRYSGDLYIRFGLNGALHDVHEGEYAFTTPWHLFIEKVFTPGIPGEWSQLAIAREHPTVTAQMIVDSTKDIASRRIDIVR
jgi:hypothetical protein